jgi:hypothetical protein
MDPIPKKIGTLGLVLKIIIQVLIPNLEIRPSSGFG